MRSTWLTLPTMLLMAACAREAATTRLPRVVLDTDANNELDDQHAIAYLLFNAHAWAVEGITTNATRGGGPVAQHSAEARRIVHLSGADGRVTVFDGADGDFESIRPHLTEPSFDGKAAVDFLLAQAHATLPGDTLTVIAVGKLTNVALALAADPTIAARIRVVWLGSNWPVNANEYNEANDRAAVNFVLDTPVSLDIATVRYLGRPPGQNRGTADVITSVSEIRSVMPGLGPSVSPIAGRHGGAFSHFGDYSVDLFDHIGENVRALFDVAAVALVKHPSWAVAQTVPAPRIEGDAWVERPDNPRTVRFFGDFNRDSIIGDFFAAMRTPQLPQAGAMR